MNAGNTDGDHAGWLTGMMLANLFALLAFASLCWSGMRFVRRQRSAMEF
jgi:hypothetical protein